MDPSLDAMSDQILAKFQCYMEKEILPQCNKSKRTINEAQKSIEHLKQESDKLSKAMDRIGCSFLCITNHKDGLKAAEDLLDGSRNELNRLNADLEKLKEEKTFTLGQLSEANSRFDSLKDQLTRRKDQMKELQDSKISDSYRVLSQLMQTKFLLNKDLECVSLILDEEQRIKGAVKIDKENQPEPELRQAIWSKFYKSYK